MGRHILSGPAPMPPLSWCIFDSDNLFLDLKMSVRKMGVKSEDEQTMNEFGGAII